MARPRVLHEGFIVPNAGDVTNPRMAEPDRIDFNSLAHPLWGVVEGCLVTVTGSTAVIATGLVIVNAVLVKVTGGTVTLTSGGSNDRFDLIGVNTAGTITVIEGTSATDPIFPDPPLDVTVLAAVFAPGGGADFSETVIDKRKFVNKALLTKIAPSAPLVQNVNGTGDHYRLNGDGKMVWGNDTLMYRTGVKSLRVEDNLAAAGWVSALALQAGSVTATGLVTGSNLVNASSQPDPSLSPVGALFQDNVTGRLYVKKGTTWQEIATVSGTVPVGTFLPCIQTPDVMLPLGWLPIDGRAISDTFPSLFGLAALAPYITGGTAPNRTMTLPNASRKMLMADFTGPAARVGGSNAITLTLANMPKHRHNPRMSPAGAYTPTVTIGRGGSHNHIMQNDGEHGHVVEDHQHVHQGFELNGVGAEAICMVWGGTNKLDALFNDRNHTISVEPLPATRAARSNIEILPFYGAHSHVMFYSGDHDHPFTISSAPNHDHPMADDEIGSNQPFSVIPEHITCYLYIRT